MNVVRRSNSIKNIAEAVYLLDRFYPDYELPLPVHEAALIRVSDLAQTALPLTSREFVKIFRPVLKYTDKCAEISEMTVSNMVKMTSP